MRIFPVFLLCFFSLNIQAQSISDRLKAAVARLEKDEQMKHASFSLYVVNSKTGATVFAKDEQRGLAPASTQKVVTAVSAYDLLGKTFQFKTIVGYTGKIENGTLNGNLVLKGWGDPTLGSWRWLHTNEDYIYKKLSGELNSKNIKSINGDIIIDESNWETQATPNGWTWDDIGNYYGAGASAVNWHENKYDIYFRPGKNVGDSVEVLYTEPWLPGIKILNELKTGKAGSGDNSIIYLPENGNIMAIRGTIPAGVDKFKVSGSFPNAPVQTALAIQKMLKKAGVSFTGKYITAQQMLLNQQSLNYSSTPILHLASPILDSMSVWFLKESINLYGEAYIKAIAYQKNNFGEEKEGLDIVKNFWSAKGIDQSALNIKDGSGLSPANRLTTHALVTILQYAKKQSWYAGFENALPIQNGLKMKSGYIGGVRSYAGYIKSKSGEEYTFAFIINNFDGSPGSVREKMWRVLDLMK